jgi:uncharacterized protein with von Willebrand factor type A (vWA) domain
VTRVRYSRWDGSQREFSLDADAALEALSELMLHGLSAAQALEQLQRAGFPLAGQDFRVLGARDLLRELAQQTQALERQFNLERAFDALEQRLERALDREQRALEQSHGYESRAMNEFLSRRHGDARRLSDRIAAFEDHEFQDPEAAEELEALLAELERLRALEAFKQGAGARLQGPTALDYEPAQQLREQLQALAQLAQQLRAGSFQEVDPAALESLLGEQATRSLLILRDLEPRLREAGYLGGEQGQAELTPRAVRRIGAQALASVYDVLRKGRPGRHATVARGVSTPRPDESRPYEHGDALDLDITRSVLNALRRSGVPGRVQLAVEDLEVREQDFTTQTTTVLLLDLSWSMSFEGRFPAAKRVALAMDQLIRTRYPRDHFFIVGFSTRARQLSVRELPEISWDPGDPFTNLQEGLQVAERLIVQHPSPSPQILVITDGQPTAYYVGAELHVEWPSGYGGISPRAVAQTLQQVRRVTRRGITINTFMLHDSPELVGFVERMTEINRGRALFTDPAHLGSYVMVDHLNRRRQSIR